MMFGKVLNSEQIWLGGGKDMAKNNALIKVVESGFRDQMSLKYIKIGSPPSKPPHSSLQKRG